MGPNLNGQLWAEFFAGQLGPNGGRTLNWNENGANSRRTEPKGEVQHQGQALASEQCELLGCPNCADLAKMNQNELIEFLAAHCLWSLCVWPKSPEQSDHHYRHYAALSPRQREQPVSVCVCVSVAGELCGGLRAGKEWPVGSREAQQTHEAHA